MFRSHAEAARGWGTGRGEEGSSLALPGDWPPLAEEAHNILGKIAEPRKRNGSINPQHKRCIICLKTLNRNLGNLSKDY